MAGTNLHGLDHESLYFITGPWFREQLGTLDATEYT